MEEKRRFKTHHRGRFRQMPIYLGKFFRMFIFMNDWKVLPMAALIAGLVAYVAGANMFITMEGTVMGSMAVTCICLWNGCFNSIQVVCREREIVKREHRSGMHVFSYISAHMIYQGFLCLLQTVITITVLYYAKINFPSEGIITPWFLVDFGITLFLTTYAADMMSLMISCIVRNTTSAMIVMPLVLIFELVFSGIMFHLDDSTARFTDLTIAKWGMQSICAQGDYNSLPMVTMWNQLFKFSNYDLFGEMPELKASLLLLPALDQDIVNRPIFYFLKYMEDNGLKEDFLAKTGAAQANANYVSSAGNIANCWMHLILFVLVFALLAMLFLKFVDKDKR